MSKMTRRKFLTLASSATALAACPSTSTLSRNRRGRDLNILFILVDDLRPFLGCYGFSHVLTPAIDRIAANASLFSNAYAQAPNCAGSRASLFTGLYPTRERFVDRMARMESEASEVPTLPTLLRRNGCYTAALGKVFHHPGDSIESWDLDRYTVNGKSGFPGYLHRTNDLQFYSQGDGGRLRLPESLVVSDADESQIFDYQLTDSAISSLRQLARSKRQFFMTLGYQAPHLPYVVPQRIWDTFEDSQIPLFEPQAAPDTLPPGLRSSVEFRSYEDLPNQGRFPDEVQRRLTRGYFSAVQFLDLQLQRLFDWLESSGLAETTAVILSSDHGINLGEYEVFGKHTVRHQALHVPLLMSVPTSPNKRVYSSPVELVDLYPTMSELAGVEVPSHCQGRSLLRTSSLEDSRQDSFAFASFDETWESVFSSRLQLARRRVLKEQRVVEFVFSLEPSPRLLALESLSEEQRVEVEALRNQLNSHFGPGEPHQITVR